MTYLKTSSLSALMISSALLLAACGGGGGGGTTTPPPPPVDSTAPNVTFSPATLSVESAATATSTLTATDAVGVTSGPTATCTNGGSFDVATNVFTAATVTTDTTSVCTASARDAAGNTGTATLTVTMTAPVEPPAPTVAFDPATLSVESEMTGASVVSATDSQGTAITPTITCTNGGTYDSTAGVFTAPVVATATTSVCTATATDALGKDGTGTLTVTMTPPPAAAVDVTISGKLTYDRVPLNTTTNGLNYNAITQLPIRQVPVELLNASGTVLLSTVSDDNGDYSFTIESGQDVRVRARSEVQKTGSNIIDLQVVDNTSSNAVYAIQGSLVEVPGTNQTRDLNAASGWGGTSYTTTRAAAPFALLDTIYGALEDFIAVDADVDFPAFDVLWSTRNRAESGTVANGQIGTSSFTVSNGVPVIRILGDAGNDTDEYDVHVVVHEFGHYFENSLSRSDSIGGQHSSNDRLDARVAFGEGWGNALSGMILDDPFYRDSFGASQSRGFSINVENNTYASTGWFSEGSVQSILYDLYDATDDGADTASFGLAPIYGAFVDPDYKNTEAFTSIFAFLKALNNQTGITASEITAITDAQLIAGAGQFGAGETNTGGIAEALPVYETIPTNGTAVAFCSFDNFGSYNKHGNRRFFQIAIPTAGAYRFSMVQTTAGAGDPDFVVFKDGVRVGLGGSGAARQEVQTFTLTAGTHVMDAHAFANTGSDDQIASAGLTRGDICHNFTIEAQ